MTARHPEGFEAHNIHPTDHADWKRRRWISEDGRIDWPRIGRDIALIDGDPRG